VSYGGLVGLASEACLCLLFIVMVLFANLGTMPCGGWDVFVVVLSFDYGMDVRHYFCSLVSLFLFCVHSINDSHALFLFFFKE
jgi:hypothetical protein